MTVWKKIIIIIIIIITIIKNMPKTKRNQIKYIWYICIKSIWVKITYNGWYAIKP